MSDLKGVSARSFPLLFRIRAQSVLKHSDLLSAMSPRKRVASPEDFLLSARVVVRGRRALVGPGLGEQICLEGASLW